MLTAEAEGKAEGGGIADEGGFIPRMYCWHCLRARKRRTVEPWRDERVTYLERNCGRGFTPRREVFAFNRGMKPSHSEPIPPKTIRPRNLAVPGPNLGVGVRHALFPDGTMLGASLSRALCFPTPLSAACGCFGLMAGPFQPFPVGIFRVRSFRPVRSLPAGSGSPDVVRTRLQFLISRVGTVTTGTAPAFDRTLAPRYGSDLLTLRLRSLLQ